MDFPAVTVCNQNRVHCGHLKQWIVEQMMNKTSHHNISEAYSLLEGGGELSGREAIAMAKAYSLLEFTGCRTNFDKYDETDVHGGTYGCAIA